MKTRLKSRAVAACAIAWLSITAAKATTVVPPTFEEMADRADLVFEGKVVGAHSEWRALGTNRVIFTLIEFETQEVLKGDAGKAVTLQFLGGTVGEVTLHVNGVPGFNAGDRVLLFVEGNGIQFCPLVAVFHGKFRLRKEETTGRDIVLMHDGKPLRDVAEIGDSEGAEFGPKRVRPSIPADREPMSAEAFKSKIRDHIGKRASQN